MAGLSLAEQGISVERLPGFYNVKESVFPFGKFPGVDPVLGPEMKSTGEVMGVGRTFGEAFGKATLASNVNMPKRGIAFISVRDRDRSHAVDIAGQLINQGFRIVATRGTCRAITDAGLACSAVNKLQQGRPNIMDQLKNREIDYIVNTVEGSKAVHDSRYIRSQALAGHVPYVTSIAAARAMCRALDEIDSNDIYSLQQLHQEIS